MANFLRITSKDNAIIKEITNLQKSSKRRKESGLFVLEGLRLCADASLNGVVAKTVVLSDTAFDKYLDDMGDLFNNAESKYIIPDSLFTKISDTVNPQGILCVFQIPTFGMKDIVSNGKYIALENLQDPSNLGAISRTAEALGINGIFVCGGCDPYSPKSLRASMGALLRIPVFETDNVFDLTLNSGFSTYAAVVDRNSEKIGSFRFDDGCIVFIGNEANGLTEDTVNKCDRKITIPMDGKAESLNAGVAAAIIMWEMIKC